jgi:hypothetical protein
LDDQPASFNSILAGFARVMTTHASGIHDAQGCHTSMEPLPLADTTCRPVKVEIRVGLIFAALRGRQ